MRKQKVIFIWILVTTVMILQACVQVPTGSDTLPSTTLPWASSGLSPTPGHTTSATPAPTAPRTNPAVPELSPPQAMIRSQQTLSNTKYVVFAWNDLGMHCANPTYDKAVLLPPYNTLWAQVIERGAKPRIVTSGLTVEYKFINNTYSYGKESYGQFWDNMKKLFGIELAHDTGLNLTDPALHNSLAGNMVQKTDYFVVNGVPLTPINDDGSWNPFQVAQITVKDPSGKVVAETMTTAPVSDEINCAKCHGSDPFQDILKKHDKNVGTTLVSQEPVLCASCHGDPVLGVPDAGPDHYLSQSIHGFHSTVSPKPGCYDCHPGQSTQCSRSIAHTAADGNCTTCHGDLAQVSGSIESGRVPWGSEPKCVTCHTGVAEVDTQATLYRNATGHGGIYCASCHSSPHAMVPTNLLSDNYQAMQYQGAAKTIGSCGACHGSSRGNSSLGEYAGTHAGANPDVPNACYVCHTSVSTDSSLWPHSYQWTATQGTGNVGGN